MKQDKLHEADKIFSQALQSKEASLGSEDESTLRTLYDLFKLYMKQGKLAEAEPMVNQVLKGYKKVFGSDHTRTFAIINDLGVLYGRLGRISDAGTMFRRAVKGYECVFGPQYVSGSLSALTCLDNLACYCLRTGSEDEGKQLLTRALSGYRTTLGPSSEECTNIEGMLRDLQITS